MDEIAARVEALERNYAEINAGLNLVEAEQRHLKELFAARFHVIEKSQDLHMAKIEAVAKSIEGLSSRIEILASEPDRSPAGKALLIEMKAIEATAATNSERLDSLIAWRERQVGVILALKFASGGGVVALFIVLARFIYAALP